MGNICNAQTSHETEDVKINLDGASAYDTFKGPCDYKRLSVKSEQFMTSPSCFSNDDGERMFTRETDDDDSPETTRFTPSPSYELDAGIRRLREDIETA